MFRNRWQCFCSRRLVFASDRVQLASVNGASNPSANLATASGAAGPACLARSVAAMLAREPALEAVTVHRTEPHIAIANLEGSDVKLEQYTTSFNRGLVGRTRNIHVAAEAVNGRVLLPGQTFSFNASTGERTAAKGYRMAHIFERQPGEEEAQVVDGLAGGTCQVSSTLFNAIRKSNQKVDSKLKIVQRETHSLPVTYVPRGLDATVAWPYRDFKFRNTLPNPIYLRTDVNGSRLTVSVWARVPSGNPLIAKNTTH